MIHAGNVARVVERRGSYRVWVSLPEGKSHLEEPGLDGIIILKWTWRNKNQHNALFYSQFILTINHYMFCAGLLLIIMRYFSVNRAIILGLAENNQFE